jgi:hypothetical protein
VLSPVLLGVYIDELISGLGNSNFGCHIGHLFCGEFAYADDVIILAPTIFGLRKMLKIASELSIEHKISFNASKSKLLVFHLVFKIYHLSV